MNKVMRISNDTAPLTFRSKIRSRYVYTFFTRYVVSPTNAIVFFNRLSHRTPINKVDGADVFIFKSMSKKHPCPIESKRIM